MWLNCRRPNHAGKVYLGHGSIDDSHEVIANHLLLLDLDEGVVGSFHFVLPGPISEIRITAP